MNPNIHFWPEVAVCDQHLPLGATTQLPIPFLHSMSIARAIDHSRVSLLLAATESAGCKASRESDISLTSQHLPAFLMFAFPETRGFSFSPVASGHGPGIWMPDHRL